MHGAVAPLTAHLRPTVGHGAPAGGPAGRAAVGAAAAAAVLDAGRRGRAPATSAAGARGTAVALAGPSPLGGPADLVLVAEEPGVGLGARLAGTDGPDPGAVPDGAAGRQGRSRPGTRRRCGAARPPTTGWPSSARPPGVWLWAVIWPPAAELLLLEHVELHDLRPRRTARPRPADRRAPPRLDLVAAGRPLRTATGHGADAARHEQQPVRRPAHRPRHPGGGRRPDDRAGRAAHGAPAG